MTKSPCMPSVELCHANLAWEHSLFAVQRLEPMIWIERLAQLWCVCATMFALTTSMSLWLLTLGTNTAYKRSLFSGNATAALHDVSPCSLVTVQKFWGFIVCQIICDDDIVVINTGHQESLQAVIVQRQLHSRSRRFCLPVLLTAQCPWCGGLEFLLML